MATPDLAFTRIAEWSLVRYARALFLPDGPEGGWEPSENALEPLGGLAGAGDDRPVFRALLPVLSAGTWRFLVRNGGYRRREVAVSDRKRTGRLWDEAVWGAAPLSFGPASVLWLAAMHDALVALATDSKQGRGYSRTLAVADTLPMTGGDRLALSVALLSIARDPEAAERLPVEARALAKRLPLLGLAQPRWLDAPPSWSFDDEQEVTALVYLDDWIVSRWAKLVAFRRNRLPGEQRAIDSSMLLVPVARFFPVLWRDNGGMDGIHAAIQRLSSTLPTQGEREGLEGRFGAVLGAGGRLDTVAQQIQATPWADRTESQKRLAAEYETSFRPLRDEVRLLARRLRRELG